MKGLFTTTLKKTNKYTQYKIPQCGACGLYKGCSSPKMPVSGEGKKKILIVAESPGAREDEKNIQLIGPAGQLLEECLREVGIDMRLDCWLTNSIICRPPKNRTPTDREISWCHPNLVRTIEILKPDVLIPLGAVAIKSVIGSIWKESVAPTARWLGWRIPCQKPNVWVAPTWHPSYLLRSQGDQALRLFFLKQLKAAVALKGKPHKEPPQEPKVHLLFDEMEAVLWIDTFADSAKPVAWDLECNALKPETEGSAIICCSMSDGERTISFPWVGKAIEAMLDFLRSNTEKIVANGKYDSRWILRKHKVRPRNIVWDTVVNAHILDNRGGVTSLKFQAFVLLGAMSYDNEIKPFLKADKNRLNRIKELNLSDVMRYNALDSYRTWHVAQKQKEKFQ